MPDSVLLALRTLLLHLVFNFPIHPNQLNSAPKHTGQVLGDNPLCLGTATRCSFCCHLLRWEMVNQHSGPALESVSVVYLFNIICKKVYFMTYSSVLALEKERFRFCD